MEGSEEGPAPLAVNEVVPLGACSGPEAAWGLQSLPGAEPFFEGVGWGQILWAWKKSSIVRRGGSERPHLFQHLNSHKYIPS